MHSAFKTKMHRSASTDNLKPLSHPRRIHKSGSCTNLLSSESKYITKSVSLDHLDSHKDKPLNQTYKHKIKNALITNVPSLLYELSKESIIDVNADKHHALQQVIVDHLTEVSFLSTVTHILTHYKL